jgi:outer membrane immunogenic protein
MKKLVLVAALSIVGSSAAVAADMTVKARPAPPPIVTTNWTGCYLGAGGGYGMYNQRREVVSDYLNPIAITPNYTQVVTAAPGAVLSRNETFGGEGWLATAQVGCDYQFNNNWVIGGFIDGDWTNLRGDHSLFGVFSAENSLRWSWAVGGRVGWLVTPSLLTYVSGGYTQAEFGGYNYNHINQNSTLVLTNPPNSVIVVAGPGNPGIGSAAQRYDGFFIGGGTEYAISGVPGLFWKNEYRYADYGRASNQINCPACTVTLPQPAGQTGLSERQHITVQTIRTELVWRFNWGGPAVVARY